MEKQNDTNVSLQQKPVEELHIPHIVYFEAATSDLVNHLEDLPPVVIAQIVREADSIIPFLEKVRTFALAKAQKGEKIPSLKLVEGKTVRKLVSEPLVVERLHELGHDDSKIYEKKLITMTAIEKLLGKKTFNEALKDLIIYETGKDQLVPEEDPRPEKVIAEMYSTLTGYALTNEEGEK